MADVYQISSTTTNTVSDIGDRALNVALTGYSGSLVDKLNSALTENISSNSATTMNLVPVIDNGVLKGITPENLAIALDGMVTVEPLRMVYNVTDTTNPTQIVGYNFWDGIDRTSAITSITIDGVELPSVVSAYTFSTTGDHVVEYNLTDPTKIEEYLFARCGGITELYIPKSISTIETFAFISNILLSVISVDTANTTYHSDSNSDAIIETATNTLVLGCKETTIVPNYVTAIGDGAFNGCTGLQSTLIPSGVTSIGTQAFYNCNSLTSIDIPDSVTSIGDSAFDHCSGMTSCTIGSGVTSIGVAAFQFCSGLTSIDIPNSVTSIGQSAFSSCYGNRNIIIGRGVRSIGDSAFWGNTGVTTLFIPDNVTFIGEHAFQRNDSLSSLTIGTGITSISNYSFCNCQNLTNVVIRGAITSIGGFAFADDAFESFTIPGSVTSIGDWAFGQCYNLTSIRIPDSVTTIGSEAFMNDTALRTAYVGTGVTSMGNMVFNYCFNLQTVFIQGTTPPIIGTGVFDGNKSDRTIAVPSASLNAYKTAPNWSTYASSIVGN